MRKGRAREGAVDEDFAGDLHTALCSAHGVLVSEDFDLPHLIGLRVPAMRMPFVDGATEDLASFARECPLVIHTFPGIEWWADAPQVSDEDAAQAGDFREHGSELADLGYRILGITTQPVGELHKWARRERIRYFLVSDEGLRLADALALPTARPERVRGYKHPRCGRVRVYQRLMLIVRDGRIRRVFYPVKEPNHAAKQILSWLYRSERGQ